jgi:hypothetical protein
MPKGAGLRNKMACDRRKIIRSLATAPALSALMSLGACGSSPAYQVNYRLRIAVVIQGVRYIGSAVENIKWYSGGFLTGFDNVSAYNGVATGDAVVIDLAGHGLLFGLIAAPNVTSGFTAWHAENAFSPQLPPDLLTNSAMRSGLAFEFFENLKGEHSIPREFWPVLVRFHDIAKPGSAEIIRPEKFAATYGNNSYVDKISFQITSDPVTEQIDRALPWLSNTMGAFLRFSGPSAQAPDAALMTRFCFRLRGERI